MDYDLDINYLDCFGDRCEVDDIICEILDNIVFNSYNEEWFLRLTDEEFYYAWKYFFYNLCYLTPLEKYYKFNEKYNRILISQVIFQLFNQQEDIVMQTIFQIFYRGRPTKTGLKMMILRNSGSKVFKRQLYRL